VVNVPPQPTRKWGELGFPLAGDHLHLQPHLLADTAAEVGAVAGLADRTCGDRPQAGHLEARGDRLEGSEGLDRPLHRLGIEPAFRRHALPKASRLPLLVENPVGAAPQSFGYHQPHAVGADVDRAQSASHVG
jgi:hypothetical protein